VLARLSPDDAVWLISLVSNTLVRFEREPAAVEQLVRLMRPPPAVRGGLVAAARSREPIFHPRSLSWVVQELLALESDERDELARWRPREGSDESLLSRSWFRCTETGSGPEFDEVLRALWLLQEDYRGSDDEWESADRLLGLVTAIGYGSASSGAWLALLERWRAIWSIPDDHPCVVDAAIPPSALRAAFEAEVGVSIAEWLAGTWALCMRWWLALDGQPSPGAYVAVSEDLFEFPLDDAANRFSHAFCSAFRSHCVATLDGLADAIQMENADRRGIGSLAQTDAIALRNRPVVELPDGRLVPVSVELVAERAVDLWRHVLHRRLGPKAGRGGPTAHVGKLFEAYVADLLARLEERHVILTEEDLARSSLGGKYCDAVVGNSSNYLAVETSIQTLNRGVAAGSIESIENMATRYQHEADQALSTAQQMPRIAREFGLARPEFVTHLVVTNVPIPHTPAFLGRLRKARDRHPKFVCGITELELIVELGQAGWSVPNIIGGWQAQPDDGSLDTHLVRLCAMLSPRSESTNDNDDAIHHWIRLLPTDRDQAA
jgi:hypothetical protein